MRKYSYILMTALAVIAYFAVMRNVVYTWDIYPDTKEYLHARDCILQGSCSLSALFSERAPSLPITYLLLGTNEVAGFVQQLFYILSFAFLGYAAGRSFFANKPVFQWIAFVVTVLISFSESIFFWSKSLLSEAFTIISFNVILGLVLILFSDVRHRLKVAALCLLLPAMLYFSHLRDAHMYLCFFIVPVLFFVPWLSKGRRFAYSAVAFVLAAANFYVQQSHVIATGRFKVPLINNIGLRVLPDENKAAWFHGHGLPDTEEVRKYHGMIAPSFDWRSETFGGFLSKKGLQTYQKYLISHRQYAFDSFMKDQDVIFDKDLYEHYSKSERIGTSVFITSMLWWKFSVCFFIVLLFPIAALIASPARIRYLLLFLAFVAATFAIAFLSYHGDAYEINRHTLLAKLMVRYVGVLTVIFGTTVATDAILRLYRNRRKKVPLSNFA